MTLRTVRFEPTLVGNATVDSWHAPGQPGHDPSVRCEVETGSHVFFFVGDATVLVPWHRVRSVTWSRDDAGETGAAGHGQPPPAIEAVPSVDQKAQERRGRHGGQKKAT